MDWVEPEKLLSVNGDVRESSQLLVREVRERLAQLDGAAPEGLVVGVWRPRDGLCVVALGGEMDMSNAAELGHALSGQDDVACSRIVIDLSALTFIDSTGIKEIVRLARVTKASTGSIVLAAPTAHVARVLGLVQIERVVTVAQSLEAALDRAQDRSEFIDGPLPKRESDETTADSRGVSNEPL